MADAHATARTLPPWRSVLVVVAHPDDESFGLGAVIDAFVDGGASVSVLCFTQGEASTLHGVDGDLAAVRARELADAARVLGVARVELLGHPDGGLDAVPMPTLSAEVAAMLDRSAADGMLVFDTSGVTGHRDHVRASDSAVAVGVERGLGVLGWTVPTLVSVRLAEEFGAGFAGHDPGDVDLVVRVDRERQLEAVRCHPSQAVPGSVLWRRLELLGDREHLRWLTRSGC